MLQYAEVPIGGRLPACPRCGGQPEMPLVSPEELSARLAAAPAGAGGAVALVGADAFARDDRQALMAAAIASGARCVRVDAGGSLALPARASEALASGVRHVRLTVCTPDALPDAASALRAFLSAAEDAAIKAVASARVPVCRHNLHTLPTLVTTLAEAGAFEAVLGLTDATLPVQSSAPWLAAAADSGTVNRLWVRLEGFVPEALPRYELHFAEPFTLGTVS